MANRAAGKGYENENFYTNIKFQFLGIENIHVMRGSLQKLIEGKKTYMWWGAAWRNLLKVRKHTCDKGQPAET